MKIDIFYNPIYPKTTVQIDGKTVDEADVYGFLYPVRNYLLQTWLAESGSWHGFVHELCDMTRSEISQVVFHGRQSDYKDFAKILQGIPNTAVEYQSVDYVAQYQKKRTEIQELLTTIFTTKVVMEYGSSPIARSFCDLYPDEYTQINKIFSAASGEWFFSIHNKSDIMNCGQNTCCIVDGDKLLSGNDYGIIDQLSSSLARSYDMIVCQFASKEMFEYFSQYNAHMKKYNLHIVYGNAERCKAELKEKYGVPYEYRQELMNFRNAYTGVYRAIEPISKVQRPNGQIEQYKKRWYSYQKSNINKLYEFLR